MIKFDELHHSLSNQKNVPIVGDMMASRWAYEAMAVAQFRYNDYEKNFFEVNEDISINSAYRSFLIPEMITINKELLRDSTSWTTADQKITILSNEVKRLNEVYGFRSFPYSDQISTRYYNTAIGTRLETYLRAAKSYFAQNYLIAQTRRDSVYSSLIDQMGRAEFNDLEKKYHNEFLADLLMNRAQLDMVYRGKDQLIQKKDPIFMRPYSHIGRAHFYAPYKIIGDTKVSTFYFNICFIWFMTIVMYLALLDNSLKKLIRFFESPRGDENNPTAWAKFWDTIGVLINTPKVYLRALQIKKKQIQE